MAQIAPIGCDDTRAAVFHGVGGGIGNVSQHIVITAGQRTPAAGAGAQAEPQPCLLHLAGVLLKTGVTLINPIQQCHIMGQTCGVGGVGQHLIPPHHHFFAFGAAVAIQLVNIVEVELQPSITVGHLLVFAHAHLKRLIKVQVHIIGI